MNTNSFSNSYKEAGVDVTAGYKAVELMKQGRRYERELPLHLRPSAA